MAVVAAVGATNAWAPSSAALRYSDATMATPTPTCAAPIAPPSKHPRPVCPDPNGPTPPPVSSGGPYWVYGPAGLMSAEEFKGHLSGQVFGGTGWQGDYAGFHYLVAAGSVPPTTEEDLHHSGSPKGEIIVLKDPLETAPADAKPGTPQYLTLPSTPGPLRVDSVQLPYVTVVGPTGARFVVDIRTSSVTPG